MTSTEVVDRAEALYEDHIRSQVEVGNRGRYIAIDIESGDYEVGDDRLTLSGILRTRNAAPVISILRIGYPAVGRIGSRSRLVSA